MFRAKILLFIVILGTFFFTPGCWNYREIEQVNVVAGIAVDRNADGTYELTAEVVEIKGEEKERQGSKIISVKGVSMFDAARNAISHTSKRLYWSHAKIIIISSEIAEEGIIRILDWYNRDSETRADINVLIAKTPKAKDIFISQEQKGNIISFDLENMTNNQKSLAKSPHIETWQLINELEADGISASIGLVDITESDGKHIPNILGTAVFKQDKLIGYLDEFDTKYLLFVKDEVKGGLLVEQVNDGTQDVLMTFEIFSNKTKVKPRINGNQIEMDIKVETVVSIDEVQSADCKLDEKNIKKFERVLGNYLEEHIAATIEKIQKEYGSDILGFGRIICSDDPRTWKQISKDWEEIFPEVPSTIHCQVKIKNTAMSSRAIRMGD